MKMNHYKTKIGWCLICDQGWLEIWQTMKTDKLTIVCSECETQYDSPDDAFAKTNPRLYSVDIDGYVTKPSDDKMSEADWVRYIIV